MSDAPHPCAVDEPVACAATPREVLLQQLLDSRIPKSEREWCAAREIDMLRRGIKAVESLMNESGGVYGLHLNGDNSSWESLRTGGAYEDWLFEFDQALKSVPTTA